MFLTSPFIDQAISLIDLSLAEMAELAKGKLRNKIPQLQLALEGKLE